MRQNLANLDRDILQAHGRIFQEAFAHGIENDMIYGGLMSGQTAMQGILAAPVAVQNCVIGTRRVTWDGKVYRYGHAGGNCSNEMLSYTDHRLQALNWSAVVSGALNSTSMIVTVGGSDGDGSGNIAANYLAGGEILISNEATFGSISLGIISNTAVSGGGAMTLVVDTALPFLLTTSHKVEAMGSMHRQLHAVANCPADASMVGRPTVKATALLPFHWEQTWGKCWITPNNGFATVDVGNSAYNSAVVVWNGTISAHDDDNAQTEYQQHIGYVVSRAQGGTTQGAPFIMLQLDK